MQTKLTLRLEDRLIRRAKSYAQNAGKSVSELVADMFSRLHAEEAAETVQLSPAVRSLAGALSGSKLDREAYRSHLRQKHK